MCSRTPSNRRYAGSLRRGQTSTASSTSTPIFQQGHRDLKVGDLPSLLLPRKGRFGLIDYEKAYTPDLKSGLDIFDLRGIDRERGAMVVVRPDQHVANVLPLDAHAELTAFFERFMLDRH